MEPLTQLLVSEEVFSHRHEQDVAAALEVYTDHQLPYTPL